MLIPPLKCIKLSVVELLFLKKYNVITILLKKFYQPSLK